MKVLKLKASCLVHGVHCLKESRMLLTVESTYSKEVRILLLHSQLYIQIVYDLFGDVDRGRESTNYGSIGACPFGTGLLMNIQWSSMNFLPDSEMNKGLES